jgi:enoyl-CoA hydratase
MRVTQRTRYRLDDGVARIEMDDGKANALNPEMFVELSAALDRAEEEPDAAIVMLRSLRPGIFSAGFDLKVISGGDQEKIRQMVRMGAEMVVRLLSYPKPVLSVMEGHAYPMGAFLLLASDVRLGVRGPYRVGLNEVQIGMTLPYWALETARFRLHPAAFNLTVTTGEMFTPDEAVQAGFLDRVAAPEDLERLVSTMLESLKKIRLDNHREVKLRARRATIEAMKAAIQADFGG